MDKKNFDIVLKMQEKNIVEVNGIVTRDVNGNQFNVTLIKDDEPYNITGSSVTTYFINSKGQIFIQENIPATNASMGQFSLIPKEKAIQIPGIVLAEVVIKVGTQVETSQQFSFTVRQGIGDGDGFVPVPDIPNYHVDLKLLEEKLQQEIDKNNINLQAHQNSNTAHKASNITYSGTINQDNIKDALDNVQGQVNALVVGGADVDPRLSQAMTDVENKTWDNFKAEQDYWQRKALENEKQIKKPETIKWSNNAQSIASMNISGMLAKGLFRPCAEGVEPIIVDGKLITPALHYDLITVGKNKYDNSNKLLGTWVSIPTPPAQPYLSKDTLGKEHSVKFIAKPNTAYTIKTFNGTFSRNVIAWLDANKNIMKAETYTVNSQEITLVTSPPNTHEIIAYVSSVGLNEDAQVVVVEGDTIPTSYIPYDVSKTEFNLPRRMMKFGNVYDEILANGDLIYRNGEVILDNTLSWAISIESTNTYRLEVANWATNNNARQKVLSGGKGVCSDGIFEILNDRNLDVRGIVIDLNYLFLRVEKTKIDAMTGVTLLDKFNAWLSGNHINLYYQLAQQEKPIENGQQGYQCPGQLIAYLNGDFITVGKHRKKYTLSNSTTITLAQPIERIDSVMGFVDGVYTKLDATLTDSTHITLSALHSGVVDVDGFLFEKDFIRPNITANIGVNMGAKVAALEEALMEAQGEISTLQDMVQLIAISLI